MLTDLSKLETKLEQKNSNFLVRYGDLEDGHILTDAMHEKVFREYILSPKFFSLKQGLARQARIKVCQAIKQMFPELDLGLIEARFNLRPERPHPLVNLT